MNVLFGRFTLKELGTDSTAAAHGWVRGEAPCRLATSNVGLERSVSVEARMTWTVRYLGVGVGDVAPI